MAGSFKKHIVSFVTAFSTMLVHCLSLCADLLLSVVDSCEWAFTKKAEIEREALSNQKTEYVESLRSPVPQTDRNISKSFKSMLQNLQAQTGFALG